MAVFAAAAFLLLFRVGALPLLDPDEGRNARVALEIARGGDWLVPTFNGLPYLDKPGLYFAAVAWSMKVFGQSEAAARLPSALCGLALIAVLFAWTCRAFGARTARLAVIILATSPLLLAFSRIVILDIALAVLVSLAVLSGFHAMEGRGKGARIASLLFHAGMGIGVLLKGPVGLLVPTLVITAFALASRRPGDLRRLFRLEGAAVFLAITLPWFLSVAHARPDFVRYGLVEETLRRYSTDSFRRTGPLWYYGAVGPAVFLPWSIFAAAALWVYRREWGSAQKPARLLLVWALTVVLFFSTSSSKLPGYILTAVAATAILTARLFDRALDRDDRAVRSVAWGGRIASVLFLAIAAGLMGVHLGQDAFHILRERSVEWARARALLVPVAATSAAMGIGFAAAVFLRRPGLAVVSGCLLPFSLLTIGFGGLENYARGASSLPLAEIVAPELDDATAVATVECFPVGSLYYLDRPMLLFSRDGHELTSEYIAYTLRRGVSLAPIRPVEAVERWADSVGATTGAYLIGKGKSRRRLEAIAAAHGTTARPLPRGYWGVAIPRGTSP